LSDDVDELPCELQYIARFVRVCDTEFSTTEEMYTYVSGLSDAQVQLWRDVSDAAQQNNHLASIQELANSYPNRRLALLLVRFMAVCDAVNGVTEEGVIERLLANPPDYGTPDWSNLPAGFEYLIEPAERLGLFVSEVTQCHQIDRFSDSDFDELQELADRMRADNAATVLGKWFKDGMDDFATRRELPMVESLISLMTLCDISYE
jgi:hypothetical protein